MTGPRWLVLGGSGLLGAPLVERLQAIGLDVWAPTRTQLDATDTTAVRDLVATARPTVVVNAAAFTDVDGSETQRHLAEATNAEAVRTLVETCGIARTRLVHISSASVLTGGRKVVMNEETPLKPLNWYNQTKAAGESYCSAAIAVGADIAVARTYWLYGRGRPNFTDFVASQLLTGATVNVVFDQWGQPTYTEDVVDAILALGSASDARGIFHVVNSGAASRLDWALRIADLLNRPRSLVNAVSASDFAAPAERPESCILEDTRLVDLGVTMRSWQAALTDYVETIYGGNAHA